MPTMLRTRKARTLSPMSFVPILVLALVVLIPFSHARAATLCVNVAGSGGCYSAIQTAINAASAGDMITVAAGTYNEALTINKAITLISDSGAALTTIATFGSRSAINVKADGVTIEGFTIENNPNGQSGIYVEDHSNIAIRNNIFTGIKANSSINVQGIAIFSNNVDVDNVVIENNQFSLIGSATEAGIASAIDVSRDTSTTSIKNLVIRNNTMTNIVGASGARGIGLRGDTPNALVRGNTIANLQGGSSTTGDAVAILFEDNPSAGTVTLKANRLTYSVVGVRNATTVQVDAQYNYWQGLQDLASPANMVDVSRACPDSSCFPKVAATTPAFGATVAPLRQISVKFGEEVLHDGSAKAANNAANYLLVEAGTNGVFDTRSCVAAAGHATADDTQIAINAISYQLADNRAVLTINGGAPLPVGKYQLFICGTTSIANFADIELNDGDADTVIDFTVQPAPTALPQTGFPMGRETRLPAQPLDAVYAQTHLVLEIPALGLSLPIVGVPRSGDSWDVTWLGDSVGWLEGSAFPTWPGNTVLTGHVWNADNTPGVFAKIKDLRFGDHIEIQVFGRTYVYEVQEDQWVWGWSSPATVFKHEERDWVTLLTCEGYNPVTGNYLFRRVVRAVLVKVK